MSEYHYHISVKWTGNTGQGTKDYRSYERSYLISSDDKPNILGSSDPAFRGDPKKYNPEELLLASISGCHMLWYLHLCADHKINVVEYIDQPTAKMVVEKSGLGRIKEAALHPYIVISTPKLEEAEKLHEEAHQKCFIANSVNFPIMIKPTIQVRESNEK